MSATDGTPCEPLTNVEHIRGIVHDIGASVARSRELEARINVLVEECEELKSDNGELRFLLKELKYSDECHIRTEEMREAYVQSLQAEIKRLKEFQDINEQYQKLNNCLQEHVDALASHNELIKLRNAFLESEVKRIAKLDAEKQLLLECIDAFIIEATPWIDVNGSMYNADLADCANRRLQSHGLGEG